MQLLEKGNKLVLEQIVTTIATVADAVEEHFVPYYEEFMPSLKFIMANATSKDYRLLRGKTIECISLIGLAVGQEKVSRGAKYLDIRLVIQGFYFVVVVVVVVVLGLLSFLVCVL